MKKHEIRFTKHAKKQMKSRYGIGVNDAKKDIADENAIAEVQKEWWAVRVHINWKIYVIWINNLVITVF